MNKKPKAHKPLKPILFFVGLCIVGATAWGQELAVLKYEGGGDWYANPTALPNLIRFCNDNLGTRIKEKSGTVEIGSPDLFNYPIVFMTGHGNVFFSQSSSENLRNYLLAGGFLHISDNYGLDPYVRKEMKKVFPDLDFQEIPPDHPIYNQTYRLEGLPKIHEHDAKRPQGFGIFHEGRLLCFYDYESDLSDGWENEAVHNDPPEVRLKALQMGANIIEYAFKN